MMYNLRLGYVSVTNSMYLDIKVGAMDEDVFRPPADCIVQQHGGSAIPNNHRKVNVHTCMKLYASCMTGYINK